MHACSSFLQHAPLDGSIYLSIHTPYQSQNEYSPTGPVIPLVKFTFSSLSHTHLSIAQPYVSYSWKKLYLTCFTDFFLHLLWICC